MKDIIFHGLWVLNSGTAATLPERLRLALEWWELLLLHFPDRKFYWDSKNSRPIFDVYTDASAEDRWEGLGGVAFFGRLTEACTVRSLAPPDLENLLPPTHSQKVRISQLELLAVLLTIRTLGSRLKNSITRIHIDNLAAKFALINCYSGNPSMARLSHEIWPLLLEYNITPYLNYVTSAENVADIFSRPDLELVGRRLAAKYNWKPVDPYSHITDLANRIKRTPKEAWMHLWTTLYGGTRHSC